MKTSKPISTISYNSEDFLRWKIEYWRKKGIIEFGMWIFHRAETGEKNHFHVYLKPAHMVQTLDLEEDSKEFDPNFPEKPLKMIGFTSSKADDWIMYCLHDVDYLASKGLTRQFHYDVSDIQSTDIDTLKEIIAQLQDSRKGRLENRIIQMCEQGLSWSEIVRSGIIPIRYMSNAKIFYVAITGQEKNIT